MDYQEGYVYHIKDEYFIKANDPNLMQNPDIARLENLMLRETTSAEL